MKGRHFITNINQPKLQSFAYALQLDLFFFLFLVINPWFWVEVDHLIPQTTFKSNTILNQIALPKNDAFPLDSGGTERTERNR